MDATSKGSDQTARKRRLILGFAGRTYHIVGNFVSMLINVFKFSSCYWCIRRARNKGTLVFHFLFYLIHIKDMKSIPSIKPLSVEPSGAPVIKYTHKPQTLPAQYWLLPMEKPQNVFVRY